MRRRDPYRHIHTATVALALLLLFTFTAGADTPAVETHFALLAGIPGNGDDGASGVLVVPGTVIPVSGGSTLAAADRTREVADVAAQLRRTLRLDDVEVLYSYPTLTAVGEETRLPPPTANSALRVEVTLQGYNENLATYAVRLHDGDRTFTDSVVSVPRGKRSVVGGLNGEEAPYLFLIVAPSAGEPKARRVTVDITPPRRVSGPAPRYTEDAREVRVQGVVIVQAIIDETGAVRETEVLKGLPFGLSEAAVEALETWRFEPALDADGEPVTVYYNLTFNFRLDTEKEGPGEPDAG